MWLAISWNSTISFDSLLNNISQTMNALLWFDSAKKKMRTLTTEEWFRRGCWLIFLLKLTSKKKGETVKRYVETSFIYDTTDFFADLDNSFWILEEYFNFFVLFIMSRPQMWHTFRFNSDCQRFLNKPTACFRK